MAVEIKLNCVRNKQAKSQLSPLSSSIDRVWETKDLKSHLTVRQ